VLGASHLGHHDSHHDHHTHRRDLGRAGTPPSTTINRAGAWIRKGTGIPKGHHDPSGPTRSTVQCAPRIFNHANEAKEAPHHDGDRPNLGDLPDPALKARQTVPGLRPGRIPGCRGMEVLLPEARLFTRAFHPSRPELAPTVSLILEKDYKQTSRRTTSA
jgi:hypothetical protein